MIEFTSQGSKSAEMFTEVDAEIDSVNPDIPTVLEVLGRNGVTIAR